MFNPAQFYQYGMSNTKAYNTYIGGIGGTINTRELLAAKLLNYPSGTSFSANSIKNFEVVGNNIRCNILNPYTFRLNFPILNSPTYYYDTYGRCKNGQNASIRNLAVTVNYIFPQFQKIPPVFNNWYFEGASTNFKRLYLPNCTEWGDFVTVEQSTTPVGGVTRNTLSVPNLTVYAHPSLQTINSGGVEGDLAYFATAGATIVYVTDFTPPNTITNLSAGTITGTSIQVNFTAPTGSTNAIDFYEVWLNGFPYQEISGSGQTITGLTTGISYEIEVKPVDIYYNKSSSNKITQSTL